MKIKTEKYLFYLENIALDKLLISQLLFAKYLLIFNIMGISRKLHKLKLKYVYSLWNELPFVHFYFIFVLISHEASSYICYFMFAYYILFIG